jgi:hypothetical protein
MTNNRIRQASEHTGQKVTHTHKCTHLHTHIHSQGTDTQIVRHTHKTTLYAPEGAPSASVPMRASVLQGRYEAWPAVETAIQWLVIVFCTIYFICMCICSNEWCVKQLCLCTLKP